MDKFRQERRKASLTLSQSTRDPSPIYAKINKKHSLPASSPSTEVQPTPIQIKPRPRPGSISTHGIGLVPPPLPPKRQMSSSPVTSDLINLKSPVSSKPLDLEDSFLQELDLAYARHDLSKRSSRDAIVFSGRHSLSQTTVQATRSFPVTPTLGPPPLRNTKPSPASFDESLISKNLIDLGQLDVSHPRFSILNAFDPLLNSEYNTGPVSLQAHSACSETDKSLNKSDELIFSQDYDPFDYFLGLSQRIVDPPVTLASSIRETIYEVLTKEQSPVKPSTGNKRQSIIMPSPKSKDTSLKIIVNKVGPAHGDIELTAFAKLLQETRSQFNFDDPETNPGYVVSLKYAKKTITKFNCLLFDPDKSHDGIQLHW